MQHNEWWIESIKENEFKTFKKLTFLELGPNKTKVIEEYEIELLSFEQDINNNLNAFKEFAEKQRMEISFSKAGIFRKKCRSSSLVVPSRGTRLHAAAPDSSPY